MSAKIGYLRGDIPRILGDSVLAAIDRRLARRVMTRHAGRMYSMIPLMERIGYDDDIVSVYIC